MKKSISLLLCIVMLLFVFLTSGCVYADQIEEGTYVSKTPYITVTYDFSTGDLQTDEIEIDRTVYKAFADIGAVNDIIFIEYQEEDIKSVNGWITEDNETYARFDYKFDSEKKQLILTDMDNGNVYHLDKVE